MYLILNDNIIYSLQYIIFLITRIFLTVDWNAVEKKQASPPIIPKLTHPGDTRNFEEYLEPLWSSDSLSAEELKLFSDF